jgi:isopentenyl phosphate kinase
MVYDDQDGSYVLSTEEILETIASAWITKGHTVDSFIYCTSVDGVLDSENSVIPIITSDTPISSIGKTHGFDVTGGMAQKIEAGKRALAFTDYVYIINGSLPGTLTHAVDHQSVGTRIQT